MSIRTFLTYSLPLMAVMAAGPVMAGTPTAEAAAAALPMTVTAGPKGKASEPERHNVTQGTIGNGISLMAQAGAQYSIINDPEKMDTTGVSIEVQLITVEMAQMTALPPGTVPTQTSDSPNGCHDRVEQVAGGMIAEHWCDTEVPSAEYVLRGGTVYVTVHVSNGSRADARRIAEGVHATASGQGS
ncbi:hypothetical protein ABAC460_03315 [Asticcacaulis sp. AC460]|uniref:hypothetical protein n=1 Tax=Asticcacaulis sp. AC460 TaxID=1282360 RepID=UPI0003C3DDFD|nr:hypothetical protein [Asticcacaulis sp. AC460]ESQ91940.1 hypothetical protein ABAC460_03315 [Asticcacaulis sp. AC460]